MQLTANHFLAVLEIINFPIKYGIRIYDGAVLLGKHVLMHAPDEYALYGFSDEQINHIPIIDLINQVYNPEYLVIIIYINGTEYTRKELRVQDINPQTILNRNVFIYFQPLIKNASLHAFQELVAHLRSPEGCPWDRKQSHQSLRSNLLEETYEVMDALDRNNSVAIKEELGDLLLQIVLHAQIAAERGNFQIYDILAGIHYKIKSRHPHVFADLEVAGVDDAIKNWEIIKEEERSQQSKSNIKSILASIPNELPALSKAQKFQERAARVGFDWPDIKPVLEKLEEELEEFKSSKDERSREMELGDLLFALVNVVRWCGFDAESVLRQANTRFLRRFNFIEETVRKHNRKMTDLSLAEMDEIWDLAKRAEAESVQTER